MKEKKYYQPWKENK